MIKHIVMWKLKEENKEEIALVIKEKLLALVGVVPEILDMQVGINSNPVETNYDIVLDTTFENMEELGKYLINPKHKEVGVYLKTLKLERAAVDFEINE